MDNNNLSKLLDNAILISEGTQVRILSKAYKKLLYSRILEFVTRLSKKTIRIKSKTFWDEEMVIVIPEIVSSRIFRYGYFEDGLTRMLLKYLKPGMTFFDIGAHFGYFTLLGSVLVGNEGRVHSFEPTPSTFKILKMNVSNKNNVSLINSAVFSQGKTISINDYGIVFSAFNSIYNARLTKDILLNLKVEEIKVKALSIDEYVEDTDVKPDFIKIDAESSEHEILLGMEKTINQSYPIITIEVGDLGVKGVSISKDLIKYFINRGYESYEFKDGKIMKHILKDQKYEHNNILFLPKK